MLLVATTAAFVVIAVCAFGCLWRVAVGPTRADRAGALAFAGVLAVGFAALSAVQHGQGAYMHVALAWALGSFVGALALAKRIEGKGLDE